MVRDDLTKFAAQPVTIAVDGAEYTVSPLTIGDRAKWQARIKNRRLSALYDLADEKVMPDELFCESLARTASQPVTIAQMIADEDALLYALSLSLSKSDPSMNIGKVALLPQKLSRQLLRIMLENEGIIRAASEGDGDAAANPPQD